MLDHSHNVTICAGCILTDLRLVLRRLEEHNNTIGGTTATDFCEHLVREILEVIGDAQANLEALAVIASAQAGVGEGPGER